ncbi:hypothetical protein [Anatilimnocola floriformis]|uniref:hypothetical protein n=1 Tax=Anatilimnocola floriformis TaxID=2948575 RepID=UPI0020C549EA|nr:hypothetical protein [Anatilimnocola floriformis]
MSCFFAAWRSRRLFLVLAAVAFAAPCVQPTFAATPEPAPDTVDVFAAVKAGDLEVGVVPQNERRVTIQLKNKTERPLTIQLPPALAAVPVLAQQPGGLFNGFPNAGGNRNNQQQAPQQLGLGMNGGNQQRGNQQGGNLFNAGIFNIPAGRAIKIKAESVCLEYGKPSPDARMKYELQPLESVSDKPELAAVLTSLGTEQIDQRAAQAAAWHVANDIGWDELTNLVARKVGGTKEMQFSTRDVAAAKKFLDNVASEKRSSTMNANETSSNRSPAQSPFSGNSAAAFAGGSASGFAFGQGGFGGSGGTVTGGVGVSVGGVFGGPGNANNGTQSFGDGSGGFGPGAMAGGFAGGSAGGGVRAQGKAK